MGSPALGAKCTCASCGVRFYDLNRSPATCPKCAAVQPPEKPRRVRAPDVAPRHTQPLRRAVPVAVEEEPADDEAPEAAEDEPLDPDDDAEVDIDAEINSGPASERKTE